MAFEDLPQNQQDFIRRKVTQAWPISISKFYNPWEARMRFISTKIPPSLQNIALKVYFEYNTFYFEDVFHLHQVVSDPDASHHMRKIGVNHPSCDFRVLVTAISEFTKLEEIHIGVDEVALVNLHNSANEWVYGSQSKELCPQDISWAMNLVVLDCEGMSWLRRLHVPTVRFIPPHYPVVQGLVVYDSLAPVRNSGPIPGGVLERLVAPEMMAVRNQIVPGQAVPRKRRGKGRFSDGGGRGVFIVRKTGAIVRRDAAAMRRVHQRREKRRKIEIEIEGQAEGCITEEPVVCPTGVEMPAVMSVEMPVETPSKMPVESPFKFLDLPAELRNSVYTLVLRSRGPISPLCSPLSPWIWEINVTSVGSGTPLHSTLALLRVNKQVAREAAGIFYSQNAFVFFYPLQLMKFFNSISPTRTVYITDLTLWHKPSRMSNGREFFDCVVSHMSVLPKLRKLTILLDEPTANKDYRLNSFPSEHNLSLLSHQGANVRFLCPRANYIRWMHTDEHGRWFLTTPNYIGLLARRDHDRMVAYISALQRRVTDPAYWDENPA